MNDKPYKYLCTSSIKGLPVVNCRGLHDGVLVSFMHFTDMSANNRSNFSDEDLMRVNEDSDYIRETGKLPLRDCEKCQYRFLCYTQKEVGDGKW